ncbi:granzyme M-like [Phymastichus coffea]|uniref:granzyme M-like n=1 Tax=Phymastichus coffea TaxID=108790 RepID=UPI00273C2F1E|nr:granzyme M-like [Phymastichus coffea]
MVLQNIQHIIGIILIIYGNNCNDCQATPLYGRDVRLAENNEFPFVVSLSLKSNNIESEKNHFCGGSLITYSHVLTAEHCVINKLHYYDLVIKVGSIDLRNTSIYRVAWWITYNQWNVNYNDDEKIGNTSHDIAIIKLYGNVYSSIKLGILTRFPDKDLYGKKAETAGWGRTEVKKPARYLRTVELFTLQPEKYLFKNFINDTAFQNNFFTEKFLMSSAKPPAYLGCGDSGSPLLINKREIIGVNKGTCCLVNDTSTINYQNLHSSVNYYIRYINDVINL